MEREIEGRRCEGLREKGLGRGFRKKRIRLRRILRRGWKRIVMRIG